MNKRILQKKITQEIETVARGYFLEASGCHDFTHVERVRVLAKRVAKKEGANVFVVELAALLHDIGRYEEMKTKGKMCHAEWGAKEAEKILGRFDNISEKEKENILHCISAHRYRNECIPETIEAKCLFDADKLDSIGAVGIGRDFLFAGYVGATVPKLFYTGREKELAKGDRDYSYTKEDSAILEYEVKLKKLKKRMLTKEGKKIAQERDAFMTMFFKRFWQEVRGVL